jgi:hypothetical protein
LSFPDAVCFSIFIPDHGYIAIGPPQKRYPLFQHGEDRDGGSYLYDSIFINSI